MWPPYAQLSGKSLGVRVRDPFKWTVGLLFRLTAELSKMIVTK
jgi:hypothetical protein